MFCKICGSVIPMGVAVCPYCKGNPLGNENTIIKPVINGNQNIPNPQNEMDYSDQKRYHKENSGIGIVVVIAVLGIIAAFVILKVLSN